MSSLKNIRAILIFCFIVNTGWFLLEACNEYNRNKSHESVLLESIEEGERLSKIYCQSCHLLPDPSMLDAKTWEKGVLPHMGPLLGVFEHNFQDYPSAKNDKFLVNTFYPSKPVISASEWQHIINYYAATSPDSLPAQKRIQPLTLGLPYFSVHIPSESYTNASTSYIKINPGSFSNSIVLSDALKEKTYVFNKDLFIKEGITAPHFKNGLLKKTEFILTDEIQFIINKN